MTVYDEIAAVARSSGEPDYVEGQPEQIYLFKLASCIAQCPNELWDALSQDSKEWYDSAVRANNGMKPIPYPKGFKDDAVVLGNDWKPVVVVASSEKAVVVHAPIEKKEEVVKPVEPKIVVPSLVVEPKSDVYIPAVKTIDQIGQVVLKTERKQKGNGVLDAIRKTVILHLDWTAKQVHQYLTENGFPDTKLDVVAVNAGDIRRVVAVVKTLDHWKE